MGGVERDRRSLDREACRGRERGGGWEALVDEQVDASFAGAHERPARACVARVDEREAGEVEAVADGAARRVDDRERGHGDAVRFVDDLRLHEVELGHRQLEAVRVDRAAAARGVPGERFLDRLDEVPRA